MENNPRRVIYCPGFGYLRNIVYIVKMNKLLSKSKKMGSDLIKHSRDVSESSIKIYQSFKNPSNNDSKILEVIKISGLLHDIGKGTSGFQKLLKSKSKKSGYSFRHNEIGWAFLFGFLKIDDAEMLAQILHIVYWHHDIYNKMGEKNHLLILKELSETDMNTMKDILCELMGKEYLLPIQRNIDDYTSESTPLFFPDIKDKSYLPKLSLIRTCIISADHIISQLEETDSISNLELVLNQYREKIKLFSLSNCPEEYNSERFMKQVEIAESCEHTTIVKAPAGMGKTVIGLKFSSLSNNKLIWICPRISIAQSVYITIIEELNVFGIETNVELYHTNKVQKSNYEIEKPFTSDIIITSIDSFLKPTIDSNIAERIFLINTADVVFDEFHELISENALFASFINIMKLRHRYTNSRTLLLSATQNFFEFLWESLDTKTTILPNQFEHYEGIHDKLFSINVINGYPEITPNNSIIYNNSVGDTQIVKHHNKSSELIHSRFIDDVKAEKINNMLSVYGKKRNKTIELPNVVSTNFTQCGYNATFSTVYDSIISPDATLQRCTGKGNRFGDVDQVTPIYIFNPEGSRAENSVVNLLYDKHLKDLWFNYLLPYNKKEINTNEFYQIYDKFYLDNKREIGQYVERQYSESLKKLQEIYPIGFKTKKNIDELVLTAGANKLRSNGSEIFYIVKGHDSEEYFGPFSTQIYNNFMKDFNEEGNILRKVIDEMKMINDPRFDYSDILAKKKKITIDEIRFQSKKENTPYIVFDRIYHPEFGIIKHKLLNKLTK
jgi:CRISPR-associated endonuclease Cas3-HD